MPAPRHPDKVFDPGNSRLTPLDLERIVPLAMAEHLSSLSADVWYREHSDKLIRLSKKRVGVKLKHALFLPETT
jgi:hypothetical protein